jgi:hypothetical protein
MTPVRAGARGANGLPGTPDGDLKLAIASHRPLSERNSHPDLPPLGGRRSPKGGEDAG